MKYPAILAASAMALSTISGPAALAADKEAAAAVVAPADIAIPAPPAGKGQIVFFRPGGMVGSAVACSVFENGAKVSSLGGGRYFIMVADAGRHELSVKTEATDKLPLEVEPDETQFVACKIKMGIMVGRPDIRPSTEQEFRAQKKLRLVDTDDMGPGPGALRPDDIAAALAAGSSSAVPAAQAPAEPAPTPEAAPAPAAEPVAAPAES